MKQMNDTFCVSSISKKTTRAFRYKILVAFVLLVLSFSASVQAHTLTVTVGDDSLHFSTTFKVIDYGGSCGDFLDGFGESWTPDSLCEPKPGVVEVNYTKAWNWAHFRILSEDSSCILLDGLLEPTTKSEGFQKLEMSIPINETLTNSSFTFDSTSYFDKYSIRTGGVPGFQIERGQSYVFHVSALTNGGCGVPPDPDGENIESNEPLVAIDCDTDDCCDVAGDANNDGVFSILDLTYLVNYFIRETGPPPDCLGEGDANGDCSFSEEDIDYMVASIFTGGPDPICPSP